MRAEKDALKLPAESWLQSQSGVNWSDVPDNFAYKVVVNKLAWLSLGEAQLLLDRQENKAFSISVWLQRGQRRIFWSKAISMYSFLVIHWRFMLFETPLWIREYHVSGTKSYHLLHSSFVVYAKCAQCGSQVFSALLCPPFKSPSL